MIISRTPYRISFFGGGTDYPEWFEENGGAVVASAINKYAYIFCQRTPRFLDYKYRISYRTTEIVGDIDEIEHPAVRESIRYLEIPFGLELHHHGDLLARSGVGSSSAFVVGLLNVLRQLLDKRMSPAALAREAIDLERNVLGERVGCQDQYTCALGGLNFLQFGAKQTVSIHPITPHPKVLAEIDDRMVVVYSGVQRTSSVVSAPLLDDMKKNEGHLQATYDMALRARKILDDGDDLDEFGEMFRSAWETKARVNRLAVTPALQELHDRALACGALGGKVLGAGGGGFMLFWLRSGRREQFVRDLGDLPVIPVRLEPSGTSIVFADQASEVAAEDSWSAGHEVPA